LFIIGIVDPNDEATTMASWCLSAAGAARWSDGIDEGESNCRGMA
jgi:hypothetical protein